MNVSKLSPNLGIITVTITIMISSGWKAPFTHAFKVCFSLSFSLLFRFLFICVGPNLSLDASASVYVRTRFASLERRDEQGLRRNLGCPAKVGWLVAYR